MCQARLGSLEIHGMVRWEAEPESDQVQGYGERKLLVFLLNISRSGASCVRCRNKSNTPTSDQ